MKKIEFTIELEAESGGVRECSAQFGLANGGDAILMGIASPGCANDRIALTADDAEFLAICLQRMATVLRNSD